MLRPKIKVNKTPFLGINNKIDVLQLNEQFVWDCRNVDFNLDGIRKRAVLKFFCNQPDNDVIIRLCNYHIPNGYYLLGFTKTKLTKYNSGNNSFEQVGTNTYQGTDYLYYVTGFNSVFFTNDNDRLKYWNYTMTDFDDVPGLDDAEPGGVNVTRAKTVAVFENFLVIANTLEDGNYYKTRVRWSRYGDYTVWKNNSDGTGMAGYFDLQEEPSEIIALVPFGNLLLVFKPDAIYGIRFVGTPYVFVVEKLVDNIGMIAPFAYTYYLNSVVFLGQDNIYSFNGSSITPIGDNITTYFFNTVNLNYSTAIRMYSDEKNHLIYLFYPTAEVSGVYCDRGLVLNTELKSWTVYDIELLDIVLGNKTSDWSWDTTGQSWDNISRTWEEAQTGEGTYQLLSSTTAILYLERGGVDYQDFGQQCYFLTKVYNFDNLVQVKRLFEIGLIGTYPDNLQVTVYYGDEPFNLRYYQTFEVPADGKIQCDISAKFFQFKFQLKEFVLDFNLISFYVRFSERGLR